MPDYICDLSDLLKTLDFIFYVFRFSSLKATWKESSVKSLNVYQRIFLFLRLWNLWILRLTVFLLFFFWNPKHTASCECAHLPIRHAVMTAVIVLITKWDCVMLSLTPSTDTVYVAKYHHESRVAAFVFATMGVILWHALNCLRTFPAI